MPSEPGWSRAQRRLHWWSAAFVLLAFAIAWAMVAVPLEELFAKFVLYQLHKTLGLAAFGLLVARLVVRARHGRPAWDALPAWQRRAAAATHAAMLALLAVVPVLGYFTAATAPARVPTLFLGVIPVPHVVGPNDAWFAVLRPLHRALAIALVGLAALHATAAIRHHLAGRPTLRRMWRGEAAFGRPH
jgi:cytochrome b561